MKASIFILLSCVTAFLIGCGSPAVKPIITDSHTFDAPYNSVWSATVQTFAERSLPVSTLEKDSGFITTKARIIDYGVFSKTTFEAIAVHPNIALGTWQNPKLNVYALVSSEGPDSTRVKINTHIEAFESNVTDKSYICFSKGVIEKNILDAIQSKLYAMSQKVPTMSTSTSQVVVGNKDASSAVKSPPENGSQESPSVPQRRIIGYRAKVDPATGKYVTYPVYEDEKK